MGVVTALSFLRWLLVALLLCTPPADAPVWRAAYGTMGGRMLTGMVVWGSLVGGKSRATRSRTRTQQEVRWQAAISPVAGGASLRTAYHF